MEVFYIYFKNDPTTKEAEGEKLFIKTFVFDIEFAQSCAQPQAYGYFFFCLKSFCEGFHVTANLSAILSHS